MIDVDNAMHGLPDALLMNNPRGSNANNEGSFELRPPMVPSTSLGVNDSMIGVPPHQDQNNNNMVVDRNGAGRLNFGSRHSEDAQDPLNKADGSGQRNQGFGDVGLDVDMGG